MRHRGTLEVHTSSETMGTVMEESVPMAGGLRGHQHTRVEI